MTVWLWLYDCVAVTVALGVAVVAPPGFAASCDHEFQDAAQWASWGIDYVKDDSCSNCRNDDNLDYHTMWLALELTQRPIVLTVEGNPDDALISKGGYGNAKRVGHDISPNWGSMTSLVDIGAPLWPFAHNSSSATFGGWWRVTRPRAPRPFYPLENLLSKPLGPPFTPAPSAGKISSE